MRSLATAILVITACLYLPVGNAQRNMEPVQSESIVFEQGSAQIDAEGHDKIIKLVEFLLSASKNINMPFSVILTSMSDWCGSEEQALADSRRRALAVEAAYIAHGMPRENIKEVRWLGSSWRWQGLYYPEPEAPCVNPRLNHVALDLYTPPPPPGHWTTLPESPDADAAQEEKASK